MIDEGLVRDINKLDNSRNMRKSHYSLFEPFHINVAQSKRLSTYVTRAKLIRLFFPRKAFAVQTSHRDLYPLTGTIKVQFELSDLPEHKELGPTLVIRVLDIVEPITVDPLYTENRIPPIPVPGILLHRNGCQRNVYILHFTLKDQPMADDLLELMKTSRM
ncbi:hypothetical protein BJ912DRAFT_676552 [Pholiota molesta]|nr:hypothetical protein BJ912DRAFT_676552 [Pholiota molesta]